MISRPQVCTSCKIPSANWKTTGERKLGIQQSVLFRYQLSLAIKTKMAATCANQTLRGCYMIPGGISYRLEFTPVTFHGSVIIFIRQQQNVIPERVIPALVSHLGSSTGARFSFRYEKLFRYHANEV